MSELPLIVLADVLASKLGMNVDAVAYDVGYFARVAEWPRPDDYEQAKGWDDADAELKEGLS